MERKRLNPIDIAAIIVSAAIWGFLIGNLFGCSNLGSISPVNDRQSAAVDIVWRYTYGQKDDPPQIRWMTGGNLNCDDGRGFIGYDIVGEDPKSLSVVPVCVSGFTLVNSEIMLAYTGQALSATSMAHELWHVRDFRHGVIDRHHTGKAWKHLYECIADADPVCGIVERAQGNMIARGY